MSISPDTVILWRDGFVHLNLTIVTTWALMLALVVAGALVSRKLTPGPKPSRFQALIELVVGAIESQIAQVGLSQPRRYLPFLGTLFVFLAFANLCTILPGYQPPTGSLSTTAGLALCVFVAVPVYGIGGQGLRGYLRTYVEPTFLMLPFNVIGELTRTLTLAIRLFGNMMSGAMIVAILLTVTPFLFPIVMNVLGLLTGMVQAYIFTVLATVYIAAATQPSAEPSGNNHG